MSKYTFIPSFLYSLYPSSPSFFPSFIHFFLAFLYSFLSFLYSFQSFSPFFLPLSFILLPWSCQSDFILILTVFIFLLHSPLFDKDVSLKIFLVDHLPGVCFPFKTVYPLPVKILQNSINKTWPGALR